MAEYQHRLDKLEAALSSEQHFVWRDLGETRQEAVQRYATARGENSREGDVIGRPRPV